MTVTQTDIANEALDLVGAATIVSLNDPTPEAGIVARALVPTMRRVLQSYPWSCATRTIRLTALAVVAPDPDGIEGEERFALPDDCLRVVSAAENACWRVESLGTTTLGADAKALVVSGASTDGVAIRYIADVTEPWRLDPLLREVIVHELAIKVAAKLTESPQRIAALTRKAINARKLAMACNARQASTPALVSGSSADHGTWADAMGAEV